MIDMAGTPQPDYDHDPSAPWPAIDWVVVLPTTLLVAIIAWAMIAGVLSLGPAA